MRRLKHAVTAFVAATLAWSPAAAAPILKPDADDDQRQAWIDEHLVLGSDVLSRVGSGGAELFNPALLEKTADGALVGWFRAEYFQPRKVPSGTFRSNKQRVELDCRGARMRVLESEAYRDNNLTGTRFVLRSEPSDWSEALPEDSPAGQELRQACSYASLVGGPDWARATPPPPASADADAMRAWRVRHITTGEHTLLTSEGTVLYYYAPQDLERTKSGGIKVRLREEFALPDVIQTTGVRSLLTTYEFDCSKRRYRTSDHVVFPGSNLLGTPYAELDESDLWRAAVAGDVDARLGRTLCRLADDPKLSVEEASRPDAPPGPVKMDIDGVRAWTDRYINLNDYAVIAPNGVGLQLYWPSGLTALRNGNVVVITRMEAFQPQQSAGMSMRSGLFETEFDCRTPRNRVISMELYEHLNLEGEARRLEQGTPWLSFEGNPDGARLREELCAQRALLGPNVDRDLALIPNPRSADDEDVEDWLSQYIDPREDVYAGHTDQAAGLFSIAEGERTRQDHIRVWTRMESFDPEVDEGVLTRSVRALQEFDCADGRIRTLALEAYPGANLTGEKREYQPPEAEWRYVKPQTMESTFATAVCDLKDELDAEAEDAMSRPNLPRRDAKTPL